LTLCWLRNNDLIYELLRLAGLLMVVTGGVGAAFQRHLGRILGFAVITEIGFTLLAAGLREELGLVFVMVLPRALGLGIWSLALASLWNQNQDLSYANVHGIARKMPVVAGAMVVAQFSIAGFPLLAGFPVKWILWTVSCPLVGGFDLCWGVLANRFGITHLAVLTGQMSSRENTENWQYLILLIIGVTALFLVGFFPQWFLPTLLQGLNAFTHLAP
jgi:formate hydrogenlyase subunit 3/multisubunit Na+/H+ antiporter MnhD subunit